VRAYNNGPRVISAGELQYAFWWLEEEVQDTNPSGDRYYDPTANSFLETARVGLGFDSLDDLKTVDSEGAYGVAVMNFWKLNAQGEREERQSMLVRVPDGGLTLVMLGTAVLGCVALRRRLER
jgi:hypothetical protein